MVFSLYVMQCTYMTRAMQFQFVKMSEYEKNFISLLIFLAIFALSLVFPHSCSLFMSKSTVSLLRAASIQIITSTSCKSVERENVKKDLKTDEPYDESYKSYNSLID